MPFPCDPQRTRFNDVFVIQPQREYSCSANRGKPDNVRSTIRPGKVLAPQLSAGIEKWDKITSQRIKGVRFRAFILIAAVASGTKVLYIVAAPNARGRTWSMTRGIPITRREVWQYSHRS